MERTISKLAHIHLDRIIVLSECVVLCALFVLYTYFVVVSVANVVIRKDALVTIQEMETHIGELETNYFAKLDTLTSDMLAGYGLVQKKPSAYVAVISASERLTQRD